MKFRGSLILAFIAGFAVFGAVGGALRTVDLRSGESYTVNPSTLSESIEIRCYASGGAGGNSLGLACRESSQACVQYATQRSSSSSLENMILIATSCRGNTDDSCLRYVAERSSSSSLENMLLIAEACRGNRDESCVRYAAQRSSTSSLDGLLPIARGCASFN